jgi:hypothetical protein
LPLQFAILALHRLRPGSEMAFGGNGISIGTVTTDVSR